MPPSNFSLSVLCIDACTPTCPHTYTVPNGQQNCNTDTVLHCHTYFDNRLSLIPVRTHIHTHISMCMGNAWDKGLSCVVKAGHTVQNGTKVLMFLSIMLPPPKRQMQAGLSSATLVFYQTRVSLHCSDTEGRHNIWILYIPCLCSTKYLYNITNQQMYRDHTAGWIHSVRTDNSTFEKVEEFKYSGTTLTKKNSIAEEIKGRLKKGNACYHLVHNLLSSKLLSKNLKIKKYSNNFAYCFIWVWNLVTDIEGGKEAEGV